MERAVRIVNRRGLHARAAAKLVTIVERFDASVEVVHDDQAVAAASIMGLMMMGASNGETLLLRAQGKQASEALEAVAMLIESGFGEQD